MRRRLALLYLPITLVMQAEQSVMYSVMYVCVFLCGTITLNEMTFDLHIWYAGST